MLLSLMILLPVLLMMLVMLLQSMMQHIHREAMVSIHKHASARDS